MSQKRDFFFLQVLVEELALRDELEDEKEVKNEFISLLIAVQNKRRMPRSEVTNSSNSSSTASAAAQKRRNRLSLVSFGSANEQQHQQQQQQHQQQHQHQPKQQRRQSAFFGGEMGKKSNLSSTAAAAAASRPSPPPPTAVVPYDETTPVDVAMLRVFIKILAAIRDDSPNVPTLLTDYILKVLCPRQTENDRLNGRLTVGEDDIVDL